VEGNKTGGGVRKSITTQKEKMKKECQASARKEGDKLTQESTKAINESATTEGENLEKEGGRGK